MIPNIEIILPPSYDDYVRAVEGEQLIPALEKSTRQIRKLLKRIPHKKVDYAYAEGKWTIREVLQHLIDAERIFVTRALWFARKSPSPLPGFDENMWAVTSNASRRKWKDLREEFLTLRASTEKFFRSLDEEQLSATGTANEKQLNVYGLGIVCSGHVLHHARVIKERYLSKK